MTGHTTPTELEALRAEVAALRREVRREHRWRGAPGARWLGAALVLLLALVPAALGASDRFGDVPDDAFYHDDASAIADAGVTLGCGGGNYCPDDFVTRGEMAAFMARIGGLGTNPPVANAATAQAVAAGAVTPAGLSAAGSIAGQVLTSTGAGVAWQALPAGGAVAVTIRTGTANVAAGGQMQGTAEANCDTGEVVVGGGHSVAPDVTSFAIEESFPSTNAQWTVRVSNSTGTAFVLTAYALCVVAP